MANSGVLKNYFHLNFGYLFSYISGVSYLIIVFKRITVYFKRLYLNASISAAYRKFKLLESYSAESNKNLILSSSRSRIYFSSLDLGNLALKLGSMLSDSFFGPFG